MVMKIKDGEYDPTLDQLPESQEMADFETEPMDWNEDDARVGVSVIQANPLPNKTNGSANRKSRVEWMRKDSNKLEAMDCESVHIAPGFLYVLNDGVKKVTKVDLSGMTHVTFYPAEKLLEQIDWPPPNNSIDSMP